MPGSNSIKDLRGDRFSKRYLEPVGLPFTVVSGRSSETVVPMQARSWGYRFGIFWSETGLSDDRHVVVAEVQAGGQAQAEGLRAGDVILEIDGTPVRVLSDLTKHLDTLPLPTSVSLTVEGNGGTESRTVRLRVEPLLDARSVERKAGSEVESAYVPHVSTFQSIAAYVECILSNPLQTEITDPGVPADPEFGCLGSGMDFVLGAVSPSEIRNAIVRCEKRLKDVNVTVVELQPKGQMFLVPGIRVEGTVVQSGDHITIDLEIENISRRRKLKDARR